MLLDYDGTLVPIVERHELTTLPADTRELLRSLTKRFEVAVISGRSLVEIEKLVGLKEIYYVGNHGFEISGPKGRFFMSEAEDARPIVTKICRKLQEKIGGIEGAIVEDKGLTASVHYRLVARRKFRSLKKNFEKVIKPHVDAGEIKITRGKKVFEIRPNIAWDKGKAVLWLIGIIDAKKKLTPVYMGDDRTDEDAFMVLRDGGITVLVSGRRKRSHAEFYLGNVCEVKTFLEKLVEWSS